MPDAYGKPLTGEEVLFADGTTGTVKRYMRTALGGHVVEMAKPCKQEYVTVTTFLPNGFWSAGDRMKGGFITTPPDAGNLILGPGQLFIKPDGEPPVQLGIVGQLTVAPYRRNVWLWATVGYVVGVVMGGLTVWSWLR
jgi:hypothetical protein